MWAKTFWNSVLQRSVFGCLNLGNSTVKSRTLQSRCYGEVLHLPLVCRGLNSLEHTLRGAIYTYGVGVILSVYLTGFPRTETTNGQKRVHAFLLYCADSILFD